MLTNHHALRVVNEATKIQYGLRWWMNEVCRSHTGTALPAHRLTTCNGTVARAL